MNPCNHLLLHFIPLISYLMMFIYFFFYYCFYYFIHSTQLFFFLLISFHLRLNSACVRVCVYFYCVSMLTLRWLCDFFSLSVFFIDFLPPRIQAEFLLFLPLTLIYLFIFFVHSLILPPSLSFHCCPHKKKIYQRWCCSLSKLLFVIVLTFMALPTPDARTHTQTHMLSLGHSRGYLYFMYFILFCTCCILFWSC